MPDLRQADEERARLEVLHGLQLLDSPPEERFDRITRLARRTFGVAIAAVTLVDADRTWCKSWAGDAPDALPHAASACHLTIQQGMTLVVPDIAREPRLAPLHGSLGFYAGRPLVVHGQRVGALCIADHAPRTFSAEDHATLLDLARLVEAELDTVNLAEAWLTAEESRDRIKRERNFTSAVIQTAGSLVMVCDREGRIVSFNRACEQTTGLAADAVKGRPYWEVVAAPEQAAALRDGFLARGPGDYPRHAEAQWVAPDGRLRVVRWTATALLAADGTIDFVVGTGTDVTERAALERLKDEFLGVVSHELRTPLTSIRGALGLLCAGHLGELPPKGQRMVEIAAMSAERLARLVNDILDVERLQSGHLPLAFKACDARDLMTQAATMIAPQAAEAHVTVEVEPMSQALLADPDRVVQVLTNLLNNAVKFSPRGGQVKLRAERRPEGVCFEVQDRGRGIPADQLETIFERFRQVDASDSREHGGTGLGLAICRGLVTQHGGRIWAENAPGGGALLRLTLPERGAVVELKASVPQRGVC